MTNVNGALWLSEECDRKKAVEYEENVDALLRDAR